MAYAALKLIAGLFTAACGVLWVASAPDQHPTAPPAAVTITTADWTSPQATTTTVFPAWDGCDSIPLYAYRAGWADWDIETLMRVIYRESRCDPNAYNKTDPHTGSYGLAQLNGYWCRPSKYWPQGWLQAQGIVTRCADLWDPLTNLRAAQAIHRNSGWLPWRTADE